MRLERIGAAVLFLLPSMLSPRQAGSTQSGRPKGPDMTVYGLHLGEKFALPECPRDAIVVDTPVPCFEWAYGDDSFPNGSGLKASDTIPANTPVVTDKVVIDFPLDAIPDHFFVGSISGLVVGGNLEKVTILTDGLPHQDYWLSSLKRKYGEPESLKEVSKQNAFGAIVVSHVARWRFSNLVVVDFQGTLNSTDVGSVEVATHKGVEFLTGKRGVDHPSNPRTTSKPKL